MLVRGLIALAVSCVAAPLVLRALRRGQVLDHPSERSSHRAPVPRGGGIAPAVGALLALAVTPAVPGSHRGAVAAVAVAFGLLGLYEDLVGVRALLRLAVQFLLAALAAPFVLHGPAGGFLRRGCLAVVAIAGIVAFVNAFNFMDGINGISVGQVVGAGGTWLVVGSHAHSPILAAGGAIAAGAALGFAPFNLPRARMFLGDVGSYFLGAWLAAVAVLGLRSGVAPEAVLAPLALYLADTGTTLLRRVARGERWYLPHRDHAYQRLGDVGWTHMQATALVTACIVVCGALGAVSLGHSVPARALADAGVAGVVGAYLLLPRWLGRRSHAAVAIA